MGRFPIEISEIPLAGVPLATSLKVVISPAASCLADIKADLFVSLIRALDTDNTKDSEENSKPDDAEKPKLSIPSDIDNASQGVLSAMVARHQFTAEQAKSIHGLLGGHAGARFIHAALIGLGNTDMTQASILDGYSPIKQTHISPFVASKIGKEVANVISATKATSVVLHVKGSTDVTACGFQSLMDSLLLGLTNDIRFKSKPEPSKPLEMLTVVLDDTSRHLVAEFEQAVATARVMSQGVQLARELVNAPANYCHTESLAKAAVAMAESLGLEHIVLGEKECVERKMGMFLAVNQGSAYEPQFIHLTYKPKVTKKKIVLIGKGVCMDTGGYNVKTSMMDSMKMDMGGAAAVLGAARIIGEMKPDNVEVHFIVPAVENMISSKAYRPGDIITASNGTTVEIGNTDAEGRLILGDALIYGETVVKPDYMMNCATLTGAIMVGLGTSVGGIYSTDSFWMETVLNSGRKTGTALWPMPLFENYRAGLDSTLADMNNLSSLGYGGSITAALFLKEFVKKTPWCHLDLAGPAYDMKTKVGSGYGAKLLADAVLSLSL